MSEHFVDVAYEAAKRAAAKTKRPWRQYRGPRPGEIESFLARHATTIRREAGGEELRFDPSPCCGRSKRGHAATSINAKTGLWKCHACDQRGNWFTLTRVFGDPLPETDRYEADPLAIDLEAASARLTYYRKQPPTLVTSGKYPELLEYCHARGLSNATLDAWLVTSKGENCLRWPLHAWGQHGWCLVNSKIKRAIAQPGTEGAKSWFELTGAPINLFLGQHLVHASHGERLIVTEGEFDSMAGYEIGLRNIVSLPNGANNVHVASLLRYIPDSWEIVLAVDMDDAGNHCSEMFYAQLGFERVSRIMMPHKDINDWLMSEPTLTAEQVLAAAQGVTRIVTCGNRAGKKTRFMKLGTSNGENGEARVICGTPWPKLTEKLGGGLRAGQTTGILAPSGVGKTTFVNQWAIDMAAKGDRVGIISLEGSRDELDQNITQAIFGATGLDVTSAEFAALAERLMVSELEGHTITWQAVVQETQAMIDQGAKLVVIDNLDFIMPRNTDRVHDIKSEAYAAVIELTRKSAAHVICVWQPKKVDRYQTVNSGNQKGLSQTFQDADNYLNVNTQGHCRRIEIEKCRKVGVVSGENYVVLRYVAAKRCLFEVDENDKDAQQNQWKSVVKTEF